MKRLFWRNRKRTVMKGNKFLMFGCFLFLGMILSNGIFVGGVGATGWQHDGKDEGWIVAADQKADSPEGQDTYAIMVSKGIIGTYVKGDVVATRPRRLSKNSILSKPAIIISTTYK